MTSRWKSAQTQGVKAIIELDHTFSTGKPTDYNEEAILDLDRVIPCVEGGSVIERTSPESAKAEIVVKMGAMSMTFRGTVDVAEHDADTHRVVLRVKSKDTGGQGYANADVAFTLNDGGGAIHTSAQISGKAASMGEGVVQTVLDALVTDFTQKLGTI
jgi:carbon monoxide dehydrogenase subunit G